MLFPLIAPFKAMLTKMSEFLDHPQNRITCSFCHSRHTLKISEKSIRNFLSYLASTQTNSGKNITSLAEINIHFLQIFG